MLNPPFSLPDSTRLLDLVQAMQGQTVLMLVDLVADRFITGTPKRISREAPVLILRHDSERLVPGGGANAVANISALGGRPLPVGVVGDDTSGLALREKLSELGVSTRGILTRPGYRTPTKTRILGGAKSSIKQQIVRFDREEELELRSEERQQILDLVEELSCESNVMVLSDYGYGVVEPSLLPEIRRRLGRGCTVIGDSRYRLHEFAGLDGATPNDEEARALCGTNLDQRGELIAAGRALFERLQGKWLLITLGNRGMALFAAPGAAFLPVHGTDQVADVTGAGDTVIGTAALALAAGATALEAAFLANYAGGVVVMKTGTATLTASELVAAVESDGKLVERVEWVRF